MEELTMRVSRILSPLVTRKDLEPYIQRMVDGDTSPILTGKPITTISLSPGTTQGKPKFVPFNNDLMESTMQIYKTSFAFRNRTATTNVFSGLRFKNTMKAMWTQCCSPDEVIFVQVVSSTFAHSIVYAFRTFEQVWEELC
ncbi:Jasmonoyl--L-amino acid synthetase JAR6, partial [Camellia lanceoleosa]